MIVSSLSSLFLLLLSILIIISITLGSSINGTYLARFPTGCDRAKMAQCDYEYLQCRLFSGPAGDLPTLCKCGREYYGKCVRSAGCSFARDDGSLTTGNIYTGKCIADIMTNECPDPLVCSINCAGDSQISPTTMKILPVNNYGQYYLRIRVCVGRNVHPQQFSRYSIIDNSGCKTMDDFNYCSRFVPPMTFIPVAVDFNTSYIEIDSCTMTIVNNKEVYSCATGITPYEIYGSKESFPITFDVAQSSFSICRSNDRCLGTFCDGQFRPPICSPKTLKHVYGNGKDYFSDPFLT